MHKHRLSLKEKALIRRYLIWCYKTTKEDLDRIDRYYTQNLVDHFILDEFKKGSAPFLKQIDEFKKYLNQKLIKADQKKFSDKAAGKLTSEYQYLQKRFVAIEKSIKHFLGVKELGAIRNLYEEEMTERILQAREHS